MCYNVLVYIIISVRLDIFLIYLICLIKRQRSWWYSILINIARQQCQLSIRLSFGKLKLKHVHKWINVESKLFTVMRSKQFWVFALLLRTRMYDSKQIGRYFAISSVQRRTTTVELHIHGHIDLNFRMIQESFSMIWIQRALMITLVLIANKNQSKSF